MARIVELPSIKPRSTSCRQGLRKLSPDLISKARDETATQVNRVGLTFIGTSAFCLLSLLSPDAALLGGSEKINVPFAGPVSFFGFMLLGPAVLIALRVYLQIYVEHSDRLDRLGRSVSVVRAPTLVQLQNPLLRLFSSLIFYTLLPVATTLFAWKAAVFPAWGSALSGLAVAASASHVMLPFSRYSWRLRGVLSVSAAIIAVAVMLPFELLHRPFDLFRANLSGQWLLGANLRNAHLGGANLSAANLSGADLSGADLRRANLSGTDLSGADLSKAQLRDTNLRGANLGAAKLSSADRANLSGADLSGLRLSGANLSDLNLSGADLRNANLSGANLEGTDLSGANLGGTDLSFADLSEAKNLTQTQLDEACGNANTKLFGASH
jgi:Pentapeptide repeats (8 copies)